MFDWVLNTPLFTTIFSFRKKSELKISSLRTFYSKELRKFSNSKKSGAALDDTYELMGPFFLKLI